MYPSLSSESKHTLGYEVKRQSAYISLGLLALLFPFMPEWLIVLGIFLGAIAIVYMPKDSFLFKALASERDREAGVLLGPLKFSFALLLLAILVVALDFPVFILAATIGTVAFGEGTAAIVNMLVSENKAIFWSVTLLILGTIFAFLFGSWVITNSDVGIQAGIDSLDFMFFLAVIGTVTGALLYTIVDEENIAVPLGAGMAMWLFSSFTYTTIPSPAAIVVAVTFPLVIGIISFKLNAADLSGALSGVLIGVLIIVFGGITWFLLFLVFFFLGALFTKYKYAYKKSLGAAESNQGSRGYKNAFGNCLAPLIFVVAYGVLGNTEMPYIGYIDKTIFLAAYLGAMATATGDTLASEIGSTYQGSPRMITTFKKVKTGTDGAVSLLGETAALFGSSAIAVIALPLGMITTLDPVLVLVTVLGGFLGTNADSLLGATLQKKKMLSNAGVNLLATFVGGIISVLIYLLLVH
ncbi:TIGR00297 family protein [Methanocella sp. CWC-04]|uniref:TIGR00297 family protein n=1 Tax=Methanooceanicella nereidis TaxID=2052831 RepID=A0AAP2RFR4_9EURY|nr:TIGR00297 family protein [Methanocella sp. CWC-04]MCD1296272.1 TIGR00297 family protein [Methanocella sp. CWC-04]